MEIGIQLTIQELKSDQIKSISQLVNKIDRIMRSSVLKAQASQMSKKDTESIKNILNIINLNQGIQVNKLIQINQKFN